MAAALLVLTACGETAPSASDPAALVAAGTQAIDVRTPEEFAEGHVDNALNVDWYAPTFDAQISKLDKAKTYVIYCRSGNRSAQAVAHMKELGFTSLVDGGAFTNFR